MLKRLTKIDANMIDLMTFYTMGVSLMYAWWAPFPIMFFGFGMSIWAIRVQAKRELRAAIKAAWENQRNWNITPLDTPVWRAAQKAAKGDPK